MNPINTFRHESGVEYRMLNSPDKIGRAFASGKLYERPLLDWIYEQQFSGIALDVGANIANHTLWMAAVCGLEVHAYEPVIPHVTYANTALLNPELPITVNPYALGDRESTGHHKAKGVIVPGETDQSTDEVFEIRCLDNVWNGEPISLIKVDVEGFEPNVLRGGARTIYEHRPVILTEEWGPAATKEIAKVLTPMNYVRTETFGGRGRAPMAAWRSA